MTHHNHRRHAVMSPNTSCVLPCCTWMLHLRFEHASPTAILAPAEPTSCCLSVCLSVCLSPFPSPPPVHPPSRGLSATPLSCHVMSCLCFHCHQREQCRQFQVKETGAKQANKLAATSHQLHSNTPSHHPVPTSHLAPLHITVLTCHRFPRGLPSSAPPGS